MSLKYGNLFAGWEIAVAKRIIQDFRQKWKYIKDDEFDDLLQECLIHWHFNKDKYSPGHGVSKKAFMAKILKNKLTDLIRNRSQPKRKPAFESLSLDELLEKSPHLLSQIPALKETQVKQVLKTELSSKLLKAYHTLTPRQKRLYQLLGKEDLSIKDISKQLKISRVTTYDELKRIRKVFINEGLRDYLQ